MLTKWQPRQNLPTLTIHYSLRVIACFCPLFVAPLPRKVAQGFAKHLATQCKPHNWSRRSCYQRRGIGFLLFYETDLAVLEFLVGARARSCSSERSLGRLLKLDFGRSQLAWQIPGRPRARGNCASCKSLAQEIHEAAVREVREERVEPAQERIKLKDRCVPYFQHC